MGPAPSTTLVLMAAPGPDVSWQRSLIYVPDRDDPGSVVGRSRRGEDVELATEDGLTLTTWLVSPSGAGRDVAVLYLPGNGGNRAGRLEVAEALADRGYLVLLLEYRGYGGNPADPDEEGLARDARAAARFLRDRGFPASRTIYVGESIGTGVAVRLATTDPPAGIVLRSPFTSLVDVVARWYPWLPVGEILHDRFDTLARLPQVSVPVMVLSGTADTIVPPDQSVTVADRAPSLYRHVIVDGAGHNDPLWFGPYLASQVDELAAAVVPS